MFLKSNKAINCICAKFIYTQQRQLNLPIATLMPLMTGPVDFVAERTTEANDSDAIGIVFTFFLSIRFGARRLPNSSWFMIANQLNFICKEEVVEA